MPAAFNFPTTPSLKLFCNKIPRSDRDCSRPEARVENTVMIVTLKVPF